MDSIQCRQSHNATDHMICEAIKKLLNDNGQPIMNLEDHEFFLLGFEDENVKAILIENDFVDVQLNDGHTIPLTDAILNQADKLELLELLERSLS
jgi:hypothetical protein